MKIRRDQVLDYYWRKEKKVRLQLPSPLSGFTLTNTAFGLGDTVILTHVTSSANRRGRTETFYSPSKYFDTLKSLNPHYSQGASPFFVSADLLKFHYDLGNGHIIQRLQRAFDHDVENRPAGCVVPSYKSPEAADVVLHFEAGAHAAWQRRNLHPRARELYPESRTVIQQFVEANQGLVFAEVGDRPSGFIGVLDWTALSLEDTVSRMANCSYFIGIMSGPVHLAAALGLKIISIVNFPPPEAICLPTLVDIDQVEAEWFYPQSVLLHQDGESLFVPRLTSRNLYRALAGDIYPYWSDEYLDLIHEQC